MKLQGKKILLVEDDNFIGDMFIRKLKAEGAMCSRAVNGIDGINKLKEAEFDFDIIITDVMMAGMDGYEMVQAINKLEEAHAIPIVVLTNRTSLNSVNSKIVDLNIEKLFIKSNTDLIALIDELETILNNINPKPQKNAESTTPILGPITPE